jgi:hypothetical protein
VRRPTDWASAAAARAARSSSAANSSSRPLRAEAGARGGDRDRPGHVPGVERGVAPHVDEQCAGAHAPLDLGRRERRQRDLVRPQRALVQRHDRLEVRRLRAEAGERALDEAPLVAERERERGVVRALEAERRGDLHVHAGTAAQRPAEVAGPHLDGVGQRQQRVAQCAVDAACAVGAVDREVGPGDVVDEQRVAAQQRPRLVRAARVGEQEDGVLGPVPGRVQRTDRHRAERPLVAVLERLVRVVRYGEPVDADRRAGGGRETGVAGDVVGVVVRLEDVRDADAEVVRQLQVGGDVEARIDDRGDARLLVPDEVGRAAEVVVGDLPEDHRRPVAAALRTRCISLST